MDQRSPKQGLLWSKTLKIVKNLKKGKLFFKTIQFTFLYHVNWLKLNLDVENPYIIFFNNGNVSENMKKWPKVAPVDGT